MKPALAIGIGGLAALIVAALSGSASAAPGVAADKTPPPPPPPGGKARVKVTVPTVGTATATVPVPTVSDVATEASRVIDDAAARAVLTATARVPVDPEALQLEQHLLSTKPKQESPAIVRVYQGDAADRGLDIGKIDGKYGPRVALALAKDLQRRPPEPRWWPKGKSIEESRLDYMRRLAQIVTVAS